MVNGAENTPHWFGLLGASHRRAFDPRNSENRMSLHDAIELFKAEVPSFVSTDIVSIASGMSIGGGSIDPKFDATVASASYAEVIKSNARALQLLGIDPDSTEDILITTNATFILLRLLGRDYYHGLAIGKDGNLGLARVIMKKHEPVFLEGIKALSQYK